ncbi:putative phosphite transport system-binding protein PtxB [Rhodovastum atsumiense]|uniref:Phosphate/phosphite/phosphonate ABC transporter substrate-binding protein n=1 Tax=Rhodovastum atsumiense TaxID=504468 RepID=A0A5M6IZP0_9PROT|nr:phosphate/phosphite/phosphonate ABC transporter substrate-binding protein [Rhodovastum atsumiense]KAA5613439.1 phosphate/phosphite/phosphonate ABC transporter substrate-binding protein [Rhodovastum atsumiense]CAH2603171.1 putative phosphite transport system-binding protein PtxB [Rhodovastum atsumiense]
MPVLSRRAALAGVFAGAVTLATGTAGAADRPRKLTIGLLPTESAPTVMRLNEPLRLYLEKRLELPVELVVGANYAATSEALRFGRLDIAYLGPVTYILQSRRAKLIPFARPSHALVGPTFQAVIIVPAGSSTRTLGDLRGKEVAFGDPASTSGTWVPRYQLVEAGLVAGRDYTLRVLGAHDAVALAVANGRADAGGLSLPIYNRLIREGRLDAGKVRVLAESAPIPEYMWTFREGLDPKLREEVRRAFIGVTDPAALQVFNAEAFIPAVDSDVDRVRIWIEAIRKDSPDAVPAPQ